MATKYFCGYYSFFGRKPSIFAWIEVDGYAIGGDPKPLDGTRTEITEEEFSGPLLLLERKYKYKPEKEDTTKTPIPWDYDD